MRPRSAIRHLEPKTCHRVRRIRIRRERKGSRKLESENRGTSGGWRRRGRLRGAGRLPGCRWKKRQRNECDRGRGPRQEPGKRCRLRQNGVTAAVVTITGGFRGSRLRFPFRAVAGAMIRGRWMAGRLDCGREAMELTGSEQSRQSSHQERKRQSQENFHGDFSALPLQKPVHMSVKGRSLRGNSARLRRSEGLNPCAEACREHAYAAVLPCPLEAALPRGAPPPRSRLSTASFLRP